MRIVYKGEKGAIEITRGLTKKEAEIFMDGIKQDGNYVDECIMEEEYFIEFEENEKESEK